jgi:hypothetical protein
MALGLWAVRLLGPSDLADNHQNAPTAYVLDILYGNHWLCQRDERGAIASKPPLFNWLAAISAMALQRVNHGTLSIPSAVSTLALACIIFSMAAEHFGWRAGLLSGASYLLSLYTAKQVLLVRTDAVFSLTVTLAALAAWRAFSKQTSWVWFWLASAAATLTKGPLGVLLGAAGLLSAKWERSTDQSLKASRHWPGLLLYFALTAGWLAAAYLQHGEAVPNKLLVEELFGRAISKGKGSMPLIGFYLSPLYFLSRFAPWSCIAAWALWRVWKAPSDVVLERRFERFLCCWLVGGLVLFSLAAHQRADLLLPLVPAAALLSGRELARWTAPVSASALLLGVWLLCGIFLAGFWSYQSFVRTRDEAVRFTRESAEMAQTILHRVGPHFPITHADDSILFQMHLNTFQPRTPLHLAAKLLRRDEPAFVMTQDFQALQRELGPTASPVFTLLETGPGRLQTRLISNHPRLEWPSNQVVYVAPWLIKIQGSRGMSIRRGAFVFEAATPSCTAEIVNWSSKRGAVRASFSAAGKEEPILAHALEPNATWMLSPHTLADQR